MRADLCFGGVAGFECRNGDPALRAHCGAFHGRRTEREEEAATIDGGDTLDQGVVEQREARRGFLCTVFVNDGVGAAATDFARTTVGEERETEPALVFEAVPLGRVERERDAAVEPVMRRWIFAEDETAIGVRADGSTVAPSAPSARPKPVMPDRAVIDAVIGPLGPERRQGPWRSGSCPGASACRGPAW